MIAQTRSLAALVVAIAFVTGVPVAPAVSIARSGETKICVDEPVGHSGVSARGDEPREPELNEPTTPLPLTAKGKGSAKFRATVDVYFHVVSLDGTRANGNVTDAEIADQITVMNQGFAGQLGGANSGFRYRLAGITRTANADWYNAGPGSHDERAMKKALTRNAPQALNYYSTTAGIYLGWAYLPGLTTSRMFLDGIVVDWESMVHTSTRYEGRFDLGLTAVHEGGHWLGLEHTFYGGCNANGDYVDDTPAMKIPTSGCPLDDKDTCPAPGLDPIHNFMDYSYDSCYFEFTAGQGARMQDHFLFFRAR